MTAMPNWLQDGAAAALLVLALLTIWPIMAVLDLVYALRVRRWPWVLNRR